MPNLPAPLSPEEELFRALVRVLDDPELAKACHAFILTMAASLADE